MLIHTYIGTKSIVRHWGIDLWYGQFLFFNTVDKEILSYNTYCEKVGNIIVSKNRILLFPVETLSH